jgi:hypothetical protein
VRFIFTTITCQLNKRVSTSSPTVLRLTWSRVSALVPVLEEDEKGSCLRSNDDEDGDDGDDGKTKAVHVLEESSTSSSGSATILAPLSLRSISGARLVHVSLSLSC